MSLIAALMARETGSSERLLDRLRGRCRWVDQSYEAAEMAAPRPLDRMERFGCRLDQPRVDRLNGYPTSCAAAEGATVAASGSAATRCLSVIRRSLGSVAGSAPGR
ncbi:MAG: hypothetical protein ACREE2_02925 [Stellaceae bacterium]